MTHHLFHFKSQLYFLQHKDEYQNPKAFKNNEIGKNNRQHFEDKTKVE